MSMQKQQGFTFIETMLVLAITGMLAVGILVGSGVAIGQQRYRDSVSSLKSVLQQQYNEVSNVVNDRAGDEACSNAVVATPPDTIPSPQPRGTSECVLLGRLITTNAGGDELSISTVVGSRTAGAPEASTDIAELRTNYTYGQAAINQDDFLVPWGAKIVRPGTTTVMPLSVLIIRSPLSGAIMSFVQTTPFTNVRAMLGTSGVGVNTTPQAVCVQPATGSFVGNRLAVQIDAYATSQGAIEIPLEKDNVCS